MERLSKAGDHSLKLEKYLMNWVRINMDQVLTAGRDMCTSTARRGVATRR